MLTVFLDLKELAIQVTTDPDHKFDLALSLDDLDLAYSIVQSLSTTTTTTSPTPSQSSTTPPSQQQQQLDTTLTEPKWKLLGDSALKVWRFDMAKECFTRSNDLGSLMLLVLSVGDRAGVEALVEKASKFIFISFFFITTKLIMYLVEKGQNNLAFAALLQLGEPEKCVDLLVKTGRAPEAALFARTYAPRFVSPLSLSMQLT